jgi:spermidine synthase
MEGGGGRGLECQKTMDGKVNNGNSSEKAIPSCCLKAKASAPELDAKCHSTVVFSVTINIDFVLVLRTMKYVVFF